MDSIATTFVLQGTPTKDSQENPVTQFQDFGLFESENAPLIRKIHLSDVMLNAELFTQKLSELDTREITTITFQNVGYTNEFKDVYLPELTSFAFHSKLYVEEQFALTSIFFFQKTKNERIERAAICNLGVNVSIVREHTPFFVVDHGDKSLFLKMSSKDVANILRNTVTLTGLEKLTVHFPVNEVEPLDLDLIPTNLKSLELYVHGIPWPEMQLFLSKLVELEEFIYKPRNDCGGGNERVQLVELPPNLKKLTLFRCELDTTSEHMNTGLESLCLTSSTFSPDGIGSFLKTKKLLIINSYPKVVPYAILDELLLLEGLDWIFVDQQTLSIRMPLVEEKHGSTLACIHKANVQISTRKRSNWNPTIAGIIFWKDVNHEWNARNWFPEEREFLLCEYGGIPAISDYPYSFPEFQNDFLEDPSVYFIYPTKKPGHWTSEVLLPPLFCPGEIPELLGMKHLWVQEARIYNEDLEALPLLASLEFITLKEVTPSIRKQKRGPVSWAPNFEPREFDGFALDAIPKSVKGITTIGTLIGSKLDKGEQIITLDSLTIVECSAPSQIFRRLNVKQVVLDGKVTADCLESILTMATVEVILVCEFERRKSNANIDNFLLKTSLSGWESAFLLLKNVADGTWHGQYLHRETKIKYVQMASSFQWLRNEICTDMSYATVKQFLNVKEYLHNDESMEMSFDFYLPDKLERSLKLRNEEKMKQMRDAEAFMEMQRCLTEGKYDFETQSYEKMGNYKGGDLESVLDIFSDEIFQNLTVKILKLKSVSFSKHGVQKIFSKLNPTLLTMLDLSEVEMKEYFPIIRMENLKKFNLSVHSYNMKEFATELLRNAENFAKAILFWAPVEKQNLEDIWSLETDISFSLNRSKYLEIDHGRKRLHLFKLTFLRKIIKPEIQILELILNSVSDIDFSRVNKSCLEILSLQDDGCYDWEEVEEFIKEITNLSQFYFYRKQFGRKMIVNLDGIPQSVKYLALSEVQLPPNAPAKPLELENLILLNSTLPPNLCGQFDEYFNARRVVIVTGLGGRYSKKPQIRPNYDLLKVVVERTKTEWIFMNDFDRRWKTSDEMEAFLRKAMVPQPVASEEEYCDNSLHLYKDKYATWWRFEPSAVDIGFHYQASVFEDFSLGNMADENIFKNKLTYFGGFGSNVKNLRSIDMCDVIVDSELFRKELQRVGTSRIERISLDRVTFLGPPLEFCEIPLPSLKVFEVTLDISLHCETSWEKLKKTLFFRKNHTTYKLKDLWSLDMEIVVKLSDGANFLEVKPTTKRLRTALEESNELLMHADGLQNLSFQTYAEVPFCIPHSVKTLKIACPMKWKELESLIARNSNMEELDVELTMVAYFDIEIHLSKLPPNLSWLRINKVELSLDPTFQKQKLKTVILYQCRLSYENFVMKMPDIFDVEEMYFSSGGYNSEASMAPPEFVYNFLKGKNSRVLVLHMHSLHRPKPTSNFSEEMALELEAILDAASFQYKEAEDLNYDTGTLAVRKDSETLKWTKITDFNPELYFR